MADCRLAINYIRERERMCECYSDACRECGFRELCESCVTDITEYMIEIVQKWSDENPVEKKFTEAYVPKAKLLEILHECIVMPELDDADYALVDYRKAKKKIMQAFDGE